MTLEEVAARAGVSTATVSRVLNESNGVREATRRRVLAAVRHLGYSPNVHARTLAKGRSRILGVVVSNVENPFFLDVFRSIEEASAAAGLDVILEHTGYQTERLSASVQSLLGLRPSGLALVVSEMDRALLEDLERREIPTAVYDTEFQSERVSSVRVNYGLGIRRAVEYLRTLGHRRLAFIGHHAGLAPLQVRKQTFIDTLRQFTADVEFTTAEHEDSPRGGKAATAKVLDSGFQPTAILCANDFMAIGVLRELQDRGLMVPDDVSVTGFDNILLSEFTHPPLTTLNIPRDQIGRLCFEVLTRCDSSGLPPLEMEIDPDLVVRGSTGPAPATRNLRSRKRLVAS